VDWVCVNVCACDWCAIIYGTQHSCRLKCATSSVLATATYDNSLLRLEKNHQHSRGGERRASAAAVEGIACHALMGGPGLSHARGARRASVRTC